MTNEVLSAIAKAARRWDCNRLILDVVVELKLVRIRTLPDTVRLTLSLVFKAKLEEVLGEGSTLGKELSRFLDLAERFAKLVNRAYVRMIERRGGDGFSLGSFASRGIGLRFGRQKLQLHMAAQLQVLSLGDHTHALSPDLREDAVMRSRSPSPRVRTRKNAVFLDYALN
jgi:hypothetical protein